MYSNTKKCSITLLLVTCAAVLTSNLAEAKRLVRPKQPSLTPKVIYEVGHSAQGLRGELCPQEEALPRSGNEPAPTLVDKKAENLFVVLNARPENDELFDAESCEQITKMVMPDFQEPGRRISETKCLEHLWRMRFYDEVLFQAIRCGFDVDRLISVIFGGRDAEPREFPHMGAMGWKSVNNTWVFKCGATLVSQKYMLTAAHCSKATRTDPQIADVDPKIVRLGETNLKFKGLENEQPIDIGIKRIIKHPYYRSPKKYYDIAIIELESEVPFNMRSHPACIWTNQFQEVFGKAALTGWGITKSDSEVAYPKLQVAEVDVIGLKECDEKLRSKRNRLFRGLIYHQMCAGHMAGGIDSCKGDSGGPLQMEINIPEYTDWKVHYIIGVTSFGYGCGLSNTPSVYTRVSSFLDWIESIVWEEDYEKLKKPN